MSVRVVGKQKKKQALALRFKRHNRNEREDDSPPLQVQVGWFQLEKKVGASATPCRMMATLINCPKLR